MKKRIAFAVAVLCLLSVSAFARDYSVERFYFDASFNLVGYEYWGCTPQDYYFDGGTRTEVYLEHYEACNTWVEPLSCADVGLVGAMPNCCMEGYYNWNGGSCN
jgi:hypothetical protein